MAIEDISTKAALRAFILQVIGVDPRRRVKPIRYTGATLPPAADHEGEVVYVVDGAAGSKYQGSDGTSWVSLG